MRVEHCVREEENSLGFYIAKSEKNLIRGVAATETTNTEDTVMSREFKKQKAQELKESWSEMPMHGQFIRDMPKKVVKDKTWEWLSKTDWKIGRKAFIRTNYAKHHIDQTSESPLCRLCGVKGDSV